MSSNYSNAYHNMHLLISKIIKKRLVDTCSQASCAFVLEDPKFLRQHELWKTIIYYFLPLESGFSTDFVLEEEAVYIFWIEVLRYSFSFYKSG